MLPTEAAEKIYRHYLQNMMLLSEEKQLHFATRLARWRNDNACKELLSKRNEEPLTTDECLAIISSDIKLTHSTRQKINNIELREQYFSKYPSLFGLHKALYDLFGFYTDQGIDLRLQFQQIVSIESLTELEKLLKNDPEALAALSTYAVNYVYLLRRFLLSDETVPLLSDNPQEFSNSKNLALVSYYVTHCIINESLFYTRAIDEKKRSHYQNILRETEKLLVGNYDQLTLDSKFELIVAAKLCGYELAEELVILQEGVAVLGQENYIIDPLKPDKTDLADSEHRNVLFIMATSSPLL